MKEYPIERYREHLPRLDKRKRTTRAVALLWAGIAQAQFVIGALGDTWYHFAVGGVLLAGAWISAMVYINSRDQINLIERGECPTGVYLALVKADEKQLEEKVTGFGDQVAEIRAEAEKLAEDEAGQWWRRPGSVWFETDQFIRSTDQVIRQHEIDRIKAEQAAAKAEFDRMMAEQVAALEAEKAEAKRLDQERRIAATQRWIEEQREWDAFKEDAQMEARTRKERGDWYEPPLGVPGGVNPDEEAAVKEIARKFRETAERMNQQLAATMGVFDPGGYHEIRAWDSVDPVRIEPAISADRCPRTGKTIYTGPQAYALLHDMRPRNHYRAVVCLGHYHLTRVVR